MGKKTFIRVTPCADRATATYKPSIIRRAYYCAKPLLARRLQLLIRRRAALLKRAYCAGVWPIREDAAIAPAGWPGWPEGKRFAFALMHDVDTRKGHENCYRLMELEMREGFRSTFFFVPERYDVSPRLRGDLYAGGFDVGIHGLTHDGTLFSSWPNFRRQSEKINSYIREWGVRGFSSPSMHHNLAWTHGLNIDYDISTFDTDPFEPQPDGMGTIFPFIVKEEFTGHSYVEIPYTLPQDFTLYVILGEKNIDIWKKKLDWIARMGGMALLDSHPDYLRFGGGRPGPEEYPADFYAEFLRYVRNTYGSGCWYAQPQDLADFCARHRDRDAGSAGLPADCSDGNGGVGRLFAGSAPNSFVNEAAAAGPAGNRAGAPVIDAANGK